MADCLSDRDPTCPFLFSYFIHSSNRLLGARCRPGGMLSATETAINHTGVVLPPLDVKHEKEQNTIKR